MTPREFLGALNDEWAVEARARALAEMASPDSNVNGWVSGVVRWAQFQLVRVRRPDHLLHFDIEDAIENTALRVMAGTRKKVHKAPYQSSKLSRALAQFCHGGASLADANWIASAIEDPESEATAILATISTRTSGRTERDPVPAPDASPSLTEREREVLRLLAAGESLKDISASLSISEKTMQLHITRIMRKLCEDRSNVAAGLGNAEQALLAMNP